MIFTLHSSLRARRDEVSHRLMRSVASAGATCSVFTFVLREENESRRKTMLFSSYWINPIVLILRGWRWRENYFLFLFIKTRIQ